MRATRRVYLTALCVGILLVMGACSASGGGPVVPNNDPDLSHFASTVEGMVYRDGGPVSSGHVYVYNLDTRALTFKANVGSNGKYIAGINEGQYLMFAFNSAGWCPPQLEAEFSTYINAESDQAYRNDLELTRNLPDGEELIFGFVTASDNGDPIGGALITAGGRSTATDGYGFYVMNVPAGTSIFSITANGYYDLHQNIREGQATSDYFDTPFFNLNPIGASGSSIGGVVRDVYDGRGLGGVRVTLDLPADQNWTPIYFLTNLGGEYRFFNLQEGIYKLYFERPGYHSGPVDALVIKDQDAPIVNIFMQRDNSGRATVWGYINAAGIPLPVSGARVTASNPLLGSYTSTTNPTGYYRMDGVIPENYTITVVSAGFGVTFYESASTFQTVVPGDNRLDFALRFIDEGVLRGKVTIDGGGTGLFAFPPAGVEVTAEKVGGSMSGIKFRTDTDGQGIFVFNGLPFGIYKIEGIVKYSTTENFRGTLFNVPVNAGTTTNVDLVLFPI